MGSRCELDSPAGGFLVLSNHPTTDRATEPDMSRNALRRLLRQRRASIDITARHCAHWGVIQQAKKLGLLRPGRRCACYVPVGHEFSSWPLILFALTRGVRIYLPQIPDRGRLMQFIRLDQSSVWSEGPYGIPQPHHIEQCLLRDLDSVFVPLLGFDASGMRLGQGGGYYDATFAFRRLRRVWKKPLLVGLAYPCQEVPMLPHEKWDLPLDYILTGQKVIRAI